MGSLTAAADGSHMQGAMIALMPTVEDAERLAIEGGEAADQLHLTLRYLGKGADFDEESRTAIVDSVRALAEGMPPITSKLFGAAHWNGNGDEPSWVWSVGDDPEHGQSLEAAHGMAEDALLMAPIGVELPPPHTPWVAHICGAYSDELDLIIPMEERLGPVTFDRVRVAFAGDHTDIPLSGDMTASARVLPSRWDEDVVHVEVETNRGGALLLDTMRTATEGLAAELGLPVRVTGRARTTARTAAAGPLRRKPTELELASHCDFADMNDAWHQAVDETVEAWAQIQARQRDQITTAVAAAIDANDLDRLTTITVPTTDAANLLFGRMQQYAIGAGMAQQREAEAQGVDVPEWSLDDEALVASPIRDRMRQVATTTARLLGLGLVQSAVRRAVQLFGSGTGSQIAAQVDEHLAGLSGAQVEEQIGAAMTAAQNEGRMAVLAVAPAATYTATEILDRNSCRNCREVDGTEYATLSEARAAYPTGGYINCLGGPRCRGTLVTVWPQTGDQEAAGMILAASGDTMPPTRDQGGGHMPYDVVQDHPDCAADTPWAVVKQGTGELMGCHPSEADAQKQQAALYAEEGDKPSDEGMQQRRRREDDDYPMNYSGQTAPWEGVLAVEGITTGDGREFAPDSLTWADLPVPLRWNIEDSHGGDPHTVAVNVGRIDKIWRDNNKIMGAGVLDLSDEQGRRAHAKIEGGFLRGVSIDADSITDAKTELIFPEDINEGMENEGMEEDGDLFEMLFAQPEKVIFHAGRIRAATLVDIPAFAEAYVALLDDEGAIVAGGQTAGELLMQQLGAVGSHDTATSEGDWDGPANEARLPSPVTVAAARNAYAWIDDERVEDGELPKDAARFIHHEVSADGSPGAANLTACSTGIGILNGGRGGTTIPRAEFQGVYDHLAAHLRDADREPPELNMEAVTAGATHPAMADLWRPPAEWFTNPELPFYAGVIVTDQGRLYGHVAPWGACHIGYDGQCIQVPREDEHSHYMTGETVCADGTRVAVGQITVGTGHAELHMGAQPAKDHYDNTGTAVADVAVGNDRHGIWLAGAVRPNADPLSVYELRASGRVSGDWRRIGGKLRMVGLLGVNVAGFLQESKMRAVMASGQPQALVAAGVPKQRFSMSPEELDRWALRRTMRILSRQVHPGGGDR